MTTKSNKEKTIQTDGIDPKYQWNFEKPSVLVFDVNETLINFESMNALFERIYGDRRVMREWLGHLIMYSMTLTSSGLYLDYYSLGQGLLQMIGSIKGVRVSLQDIEEIRTAMMNMPAHPDVVEGLKHLKKLGYRMVTLTNSPPNPNGNRPVLPNTLSINSASRRRVIISRPKSCITWLHRSSTSALPRVAWLPRTSGTQSEPKVRDSRPHSSLAQEMRSCQFLAYLSRTSLQKA